MSTAPHHDLPVATPKAARTRAAILGAAERCFADNGFDRTRLEDVAAAVGIRRASIVYYFRDKQDLYDTVVADLFAGLHQRLRAALECPGPPPQRIEAAVCAWVDYVAERPALARVLLREVADASAEAGSALAQHTAAIAELAQSFLEEWKASGMPRLSHVEPSHVASTIGGATVFFFAAMPSLLRDRRFDPHTEAAIARHRRELLRITWQMLGIDAPATPDPAAAPADGTGGRNGRDGAT